MSSLNQVILIYQSIPLLVGGIFCWYNVYMKKLICKIFGHWAETISIDLFQAKCGRCGRTFNAYYDMSYGETVFGKEIK